MLGIVILHLFRGFLISIVVLLVPFDLPLTLLLMDEASGSFAGGEWPQDNSTEFGFSSTIVPLLQPYS